MSCGELGSLHSRPSSVGRVTVDLGDNAFIRATGPNFKSNDNMGKYAWRTPGPWPQ